MNWTAVDDETFQVVTDGIHWFAFGSESDGFLLTGPTWARERLCDSLDECSNQIKEILADREASLAEERAAARGEEYQAWCRGWERV